MLCKMNPWDGKEDFTKLSARHEDPGVLSEA